MLKRVFEPKSIAIIDASSKSGRIGYELVKNIVDSKYPGKIYPINPHESSIMGFKAYPSILDVDNDVDLALVAVSPLKAIKAVEEYGLKNVKEVVILSAGFKEVGEANLEKQIKSIAQRFNIRVIGPTVQV